MNQASSGTAAIYFRRDGFETGSGSLMGRQAAGESLLRAWCARQLGPLHFVVDDGQQLSFLKQHLLAEGIGERRVNVHFQGRLASLKGVGTLLVSGPDLAAFAEQRSLHGEAAFSCCGLTHTVSSHRVLDALGNVLTSAVGEGDAIVCTSSAVHAVVVNLVDAYERHLRTTLGATRFRRPRFPIIPLGINTAEFAPAPRARVEWRERLGIDDADRCVLYLGRLSHHAKAHPRAMSLALGEATARLQQRARTTRVHAIWAGWFANSALEQAFKAGVIEWAPHVCHHFVDGRAPEARRSIWAAADVFLSLSDNIQESFGLTPIEAMAAGLPVVVSDWNGYKDTVRHGVDGLRVPTFMPEPELGRDLALDYQSGARSYDFYCGATAQFVAVDISACAEALFELLSQPALCVRMGQAGARRAREVYDWQRVFEQYGQLWAELAAWRTSRARTALPETQPSPLRGDPFRLFAGYASQHLSQHHRLSLTQTSAHAAAGRCRAEPLQAFVAPLLASQESLDRLLARLGHEGECSVGELLADQFPEPRWVLERSLYWLLKMGLVRAVAPGT